MPTRTKSKIAAREPVAQSTETLPPASYHWGRRLVYWLLVLCPLVMLPPSILLYNSMDTPRRLLMLFGTSFLAVLILKSWANRRQFILRRHPLDIPVLLFFAAAVISGLASQYHRIALFGPVWDQDGVILLWMAVVLYFGIKEFLRDRADILHGAFLMVLAAGISAVIGLVDWYFRLGLNFAFTGHDTTNHRLVATLGNSMFTGTFFAIMIPLALGLIPAMPSKARRITVIACAAVMLPALVFTLARAAWIGFALTLPVVLVLAMLHIARQREVSRTAITWAFAGIGLAVVFVGLVALSMPQIRERLASTVNMEDSTIRTRKVYMATAANMFASNPVAGVGYGVLKLVFPQYRPDTDEKHGGPIYEQGLPLDRGYNTALPHNLPLQVAAETGLLGLIPFFLLVVYLFRAGGRLLRGEPRDAWLGIGLIGTFLAYFLTNMFAFDNFATMMVFWSALGLLAGSLAEERALAAGHDAAPRPISQRMVFALNVVSLVFLLGMVLFASLQTVAAALFQSGVNSMTDSAAVDKDPMRATQTAINDIRMGIALTPIPDNFPFQSLFMACKFHLQVTTDLARSLFYSGKREQAEQMGQLANLARDLMFNSGEEGLRIVDRDPIILRYMSMEYMRFGNYKRTKELIDTLQKFEPNSAEVRLLRGEMLAQQGENEKSNLQRRALFFDAADTAGYEAVKIDPTFETAYARRAQWENEMVKVQRGDALFQFNQIINNYGSAIKYGYQMTEKDHLTYATMLLMLGHTEEGIAEGRLLWKTPGFDQLCLSIRTLYKTYKKPEEGERVIAKLKEGMPTQSAGPMLPPPATSLPAPQPVAPAPTPSPVVPFTQ